MDRRRSEKRTPFYFSLIEKKDTIFFKFDKHYFFNFYNYSDPFTLVSLVHFIHQVLFSSDLDDLISITALKFQ